MAAFFKRYDLRCLAKIGLLGRAMSIWTATDYSPAWQGVW